ncbi:PIN domain-containing protein [Engelhardtia mirabilis]|uniref:PIN domain-containing protein n=1 Tax=Engelhardtia mirabilis TaxID=2528011 RepID=UPI0011AA1DA2
MTLGELVHGIARLDPSPRKDTLERLVLEMEQHDDRIVDVDAETARIWGEVRARVARTTPPIDTLIAATALRHGFHVMTRNVKDFEGTGALLINPWVDA